MVALTGALGVVSGCVPGIPDQLFLVTVLPHLAGIVSLLALTPADWAHTIGEAGI